MGPEADATLGRVVLSPHQSLLSLTVLFLHCTALLGLHTGPRELRLDQSHFFPQIVRVCESPGELKMANLEIHRQR